ncbi:Diphthamide biosynthesis protein 4 [Purpureocillium lavendulum]|uniref:Diphthamide biosynthesis protein 4 n=1 Tax=Purpureocillium lavendulum TaxID=1247861 RepID=A0AB34G7X3_9HYPO|nr:Diphthamide biosynthesis protein 4 [Purpureocillium lavendulum]
MATRFRDHDTQQRVLATKDPKEQKRWAGRDDTRSTVIEATNMAKFGQNAVLQEKLLATGD